MSWLSQRRPGETNGQARLTERDIKVIRDLQGIATASSLGREFGVSHVSISRIWNFERWGHVGVWER